MFTLIDESGDPGPTQKSSARYFRLAAVRVVSRVDAGTIRATVRRLRVTLGLKPDYEFKLSKKLNLAAKAEFFNVLSRLELHFAWSEIDKARPEWVVADVASIQWAAVTELAATLRPVLINSYQTSLVNYQRRELITVDDNRDQSFLSLVRKQFQMLGTLDSPGTQVVGRVEFRDSRRDDLLQVADMICGAVGALGEGDETFYQSIQGRDLNVLDNIKRAMGH